jgi:tetratricopeptide (TPR) repeat protein
LQTRLHDPALRLRLAVYELSLARLRAQQGRFDEARALLADRLAHQDGNDRCQVLCRLAAVEFKAGQEQQGKALFEQASAAASSRLIAVFNMLIEAIRMPLDNKWLQQMDREFRRGLKAKVDAPSAAQMLEMLVSFHQLGISYKGLEEHRNLILQYLKRSRRTTFTEAELKRICAALQLLPSDTLLLDFAKRGMKAYPQQPEFPFALASYYLQFPLEDCPLDEIDDALHTTDDLVRDNPDYAEMARRVDAMLTVVHAAMEMRHFGAFGNPFDDDDDDDDIFDDPFGRNLPDVLDALANLFGIDLDESDEPDEHPRRRSTGRKRTRKSRKR